MKILVINPGSTSTKVAIYDNDQELYESVVRHSSEELSKFNSIPDQKEFRFAEIIKVLEDNGIELSEIDAVAARGGLLKPISSGTYEINEVMIDDLKKPYAASHASCISGLIGYEIKEKYNIPAYIVDPVVVDELSEVAKISGIPEIRRVSVFHALNTKAIARQFASDINKKYEDLNLVIAHMGGGITVAAHDHGQVVDVNDGISGEGPFSPERCGGLPVTQVINLIENDTCTFKDLRDYTSKRGGLVAYLNTNDLRDVEAMIADGDEYAKLIYDAMAYQVAKEIGAMSAVLKGNIDAIILTGGLAYSEKFTNSIKEYVSFISEIKIYPGENEIPALATAVLRVLQGEEKPKIYE